MRTAEVTILQQEGYKSGKGSSYCLRVSRCTNETGALIMRDGVVTT